MTPRGGVERWLWTVALAGAGIIATVAGLVGVHDDDLGFTPRGVLAGVGSQLGTTLPSGLAVLLAVAVNVVTAALVLRVVRGRPFASASELIVFGFAAAVVFDTAALMALGSVGWYRSESLLLLHVFALAVAWWRGRPIIDPPDAISRRRDPDRDPGAALWVLIAIAWSAPVILSIAAPVVPFADVLPNHVAPVEHARTFGAFRELATMPSPIYGPSRLFLGYVGFASTASVMTGVDAVRAVAALIVPATVFMLIAIFRLARLLGGRPAAVFAALTVPLTVAYLRLPDVRSSTLALPLACAALSLALDRAGHSRTTAIAAATGAALLVHPIIGGLAFGVVLVLGLVDADRTKGIELVRASCAALVLAVPQAIAMTGLSVPAWTFLLALPSAFVVTRALPDLRVALTERRARTGLAALAIVVAIPFIPALVRALGPTALDILRFPLLVVGAAVAIVIVRRRLSSVALVVIGMPFAAAVVMRVIPGEGHALDSLRFEAVAKIVEFWLPLMLALFAGIALSRLWTDRRLRAGGRIAVIVGIVVAAYPVGSRRSENAAPIEELRYSESLAIALHHAENGSWEGYADPYLMIDRVRAEMIDALRDEQRAGRLSDRTEVLHVASSFQQWEATPLAVFAGVIETIASPDPERSIHTLGGRLVHSDDLPALLDERFGYVVIEGNPVEVDTSVMADAPFRRVFSNGYAEIWRSTR